MQYFRIDTGQPLEAPQHAPEAIDVVDAAQQLQQEYFRRHHHRRGNHVETFNQAEHSVWQ